MVGLRVLAILSLLALCALPASGSLLEDASGGAIAYQFDGGSHHDAPDACDAADSAWSLPVGGTTAGLLAPPEDPSDVYVLDVAPDQVGQRVRVSLSEAVGGLDLDLSVLAPMCAGDVFAAINQPFPPPAPPAPAAGEMQVEMPRGAVPQECADGWTFALGGLGNAPAPASIYAAWTDGTQAAIPLATSLEGEAWYGPVDSAVQFAGVWANLPEGWNGPLKVIGGVCDAADGGAVFGPAAQQGDDWIAFTPIRAGPHEVVVSLAPVEPVVPTSIPASCHWCMPQLEQLVNTVQYKLSSMAAPQQA